jgi:hypothetical protein
MTSHGLILYRSGLGGGAVRAWALKPASQALLLAVTCRSRTILRAS